jgi:hypothetical protein
VYKVQVGTTRAGRDKWLTFDTLADAVEFVNEVARETKTILTIVAA